MGSYTGLKKKLPVDCSGWSKVRLQKESTFGGDAPDIRQFIGCCAVDIIYDLPFDLGGQVY